MQNKLLALHQTHAVNIYLEKDPSKKLELIIKYTNEMIDQVDETSKDQILDAGAYIYGITFINDYDQLRYTDWVKTIGRISNLSLKIKEYRISPDGKLKEYWQNLKNSIINELSI